MFDGLGNLIGGGTIFVLVGLLAIPGLLLFKHFDPKNYELFFGETGKKDKSEWLVVLYQLGLMVTVILIFVFGLAQCVFG